MNTYKKEFALRYGHDGKLHNLNCEIVVIIDGLATVVHVKTDDPEIIAYVGGGRENRLLRGQATCNPHDTYSEEAGIKLAFRRALMTAHILRYPGGVSLTPKGRAIYSAFRRGYKAIWEPAVIAQWTGTGTAWDRVNNIMVDYGPVEPKPDPEPVEKPLPCPYCGEVPHVIEIEEIGSMQQYCEVVCPNDCITVRAQRRVVALARWDERAKVK